MKKLRFLLGILISGFFLYLVLRKVDLIELKEAIMSVNLWYLMLGVSVGIFALGIRSYRWRLYFGENYISKHIKQKILQLLETHPEGLTIESLSKKLGAHRQTISKWLFWLDGAEIIVRRRVGSATLHYLKKFVRNFGEE